MHMYIYTGYDRNPNTGNPDQTKPLYNIVNPNPTFELLFLEYSQKVSNSLTFLHQVSIILRYV